MFTKLYAFIICKSFLLTAVGFNNGHARLQFQFTIMSPKVHTYYRHSTTNSNFNTWFNTNIPVYLSSINLHDELYSLSERNKHKQPDIAKISY